MWRFRELLNSSCALLTKAAARALYRWTRTCAEPKPSARGASRE
jgi:hypothetical protein